MKRLLLLLLTIAEALAMLAGPGIIVGPGLGPSTVTKFDALDITKRYFSNNESYTYYLVDEQAESGVWTLFVDAVPGAAWEHECYLSQVPKSTFGYVPNLLPDTVIQMSAPPDATIKQYGFIAGLTPEIAEKLPTVATGSPTNKQLAAAKRTYAIILNGGINKSANHRRYYNDCAYIYATLVKKLRVPKENLRVIMADGTNPSSDMRVFMNGQYQSSNPDLDGDGIDDIQFSATRAHLKAAITQLQGKIGADDQLLFFVVGHSGCDSASGVKYLCLWGDEKIMDFELAQWLSPIVDKGAAVNVVLSVNYAGSFIGPLSKSGCVVTAGAEGLMYPASVECYSEFPYWWTTAINGADHDGNPVKSDLNGDGVVSMQEAFNFVRQNAKRPNECSFASYPAHLGEELAVGALVESAGLYIKDTPGDVGKPTKPYESAFWDSPSICVRNQDDGLMEHENPWYSADHTSAYVNVKIHNRGWRTFDGSGKYLDVYWATSTPYANDRIWEGSEKYDWYNTGGHIARVAIGRIEAGDSAIVRVPWTLPTYLQYSTVPRCAIAAKISGDSKEIDIDQFYDGNRMFDFPGKREHALKSMTIAPMPNKSTEVKLLVRNTSLYQKSYTFMLVPRTESDAKLFDRAIIELTPALRLFDAWVRGGKHSTDMWEILKTDGTPSTLRLTSTDNSIDNVLLDGREVSDIRVKFDFKLAFGSSGKKYYVCDLVQRDENWNLLGATSIVVYEPQNQSAAASGQIASTASDGERLTVGLSEPAPEGAAVAVSNVLDGSGHTTLDVEEGADSATLEVGNLKPGIYVVAYSVGGELVDTAKFTK
ncbi:MAG: hypothetical protein NC210_05625 [[Clostridium] fimetarium]|nr:hypothetical protein [Alistipes timonensis]MCM1405886.1 hypothetical protein [[Clostridium] fimetarium]